MDYPWLHTSQTSLIYIGDPMCSWCHGFAPEISNIKEHFSTLDFRIIVGGLRPGGTETMGVLAKFLDQHWKDVEAKTGQPFNYDILGKHDFLMDTEPSCRAVVAFRQLMPEKELAFFKAVQHAFFVENKDMSTAEVFAALSASFDVDPKEFLALYEVPVCKWDTEDDFQVAIEMGVQSFPSFVVKHENQFYLLANGYAPATELIPKVEKLLSGNMD